MNTSLIREQNRLTGSFYTPTPIADFIVDKAIGKWIQKKTTNQTEIEKIELLKSIKILDPAVGDGVFLLAAAQWLLSVRKNNGDNAPTSKIREHIATNNLFGVDIQREAVHECRSRIRQWVEADDATLNQRAKLNIHEGNSLIGQVYADEDWNPGTAGNMKPCKPFHWYKKFPQIFLQKNDGFDLVIGNPPYGNILSQSEKKAVKHSFQHDIMQGRKGTWNIAPLFIVRANQIANCNGEIAFLVPNSILRVGQFSKTRRFLLDETNMWCIVDEGNPFTDVTLEMVSVFWSIQSDRKTKSIEVVSRREDLEGHHRVPHDAFQTSMIFSLYYDDILKKIQAKGKRGMIKASRGRDIPSIHVRDGENRRFNVPYATKGRSVSRYRIKRGFLKFTDNWFRQDDTLTDSFSNEFLIATKNYPYPRCVMKPKGMIHGGGIVKIIPLDEDLNMSSIGLILNSRLVRYLSIRYLTNYAQLTTCLNTGIVEEIPIAYPEDPEQFAFIFDSLQEAYGNQAENVSVIDALEAYANAVVYAQYFSKNQVADRLTAILNKSGGTDSRSLHGIITHSDTQNLIKKVMQNPFVKRMEASPRMN